MLDSLFLEKQHLFVLAEQICVTFAKISNYNSYGKE